MQKEKQQVLDAQIWWESFPDSKTLIQCLKTNLDIHLLRNQDQKEKDNLPILICCILHYDESVRSWLTKYDESFSDTKMENLHHLPSLSLNNCPKHIPYIWIHTLNKECRNWFIQGKQICDKRVHEKQIQFKHLQDCLETTRVRMTEEDFKNKTREKLPAGINAVATKKYLDWIQAKPNRAKLYANHARSFWIRHKQDLSLWEYLWSNPLSFKYKEWDIPADLTSALLHAKLHCAIQLFPKSGLYVGLWSIPDIFQKTKLMQVQDWQLGLYTLFPRYAHESITFWKGEIHDEKDIINMDPELDVLLGHYRQSIPLTTTSSEKLYIDVLNQKGRPLGFNREQEYIAHFANEPPPNYSNNAFTVVVPQPADHVYDHMYIINKNKKSIYQNASKLPIVQIVSCCEIPSNGEIFIKYYTTDESKKQKGQVPISYKIGSTFQDTRRRLHLFIPGKPLRDWLKTPENQEVLAEFIQTKTFQHYVDDFYWRTFQAPSPFSHLFK